jgi:hypothetical protein
MYEGRRREIKEGTKGIQRKEGRNKGRNKGRKAKRKEHRDMKERTT